eukprot:scaffold844_cov121-Skeletonema_marinoi.AAC.4
MAIAVDATFIAFVTTQLLPMYNTALLCTMVMVFMALFFIFNVEGRAGLDTTNQKAEGEKDEIDVLICARKILRQKKNEIIDHR